MIVRFLFALLVSGWIGAETAWAQTTVIITSLDGSEQGRVCVPEPQRLCVGVSAISENGLTDVRLTVFDVGEEAAGSIIWPRAGHGTWRGNFLGTVLVLDINLDDQPEIILIQPTEYVAEIHIFGATRPGRWSEIAAFKIGRGGQFPPMGGVWEADEGVWAGGALIDADGRGCWHWSKGRSLMEPEFTDEDCDPGDRTDALAAERLMLIGLAPSATDAD